MCGIAGVWNWNHPDPRALLTVMLERMHHRGPDGSGFYIDGPVALAHARLAIIDLAGGAQPMCNEDGKIWVTFNGEIFNYLELRQDLLRRGHRFATESDTEVLVHLYEEYGNEFVRYLNGQFAIALWDSHSSTLQLIRDHVGIRPLFYTRQGRGLAFASEVKALFALPDVPRRWNTDGLASVFSWWAALPPLSVFEGIECLPPGYRLIVSAEDQRAERWWEWPHPADDNSPRNEEALADELHELLVDAVRLQLRSDVPVGAYLSGGLDSSIITTVIQRSTNTALRSFSLTFEDAEFDESEHQQVLTSYLGSSHSSIACSSEDIAAGFARAIWHAETPVVRAAPVPMMRLADSVRQAGYKVVLTGEGADEVFGGYDIFKEAKVRRYIARHPGSPSRARILERLYPYLRNSPVGARALSQRFFTEGEDQMDKPWYAHLTRLNTTRRTLGFFDVKVQERLNAWDPYGPLTTSLPADISDWPPLPRDQAVEAATLMSGYLLASQGDRMAMAASIEARFPFLDPRVIKFGAELPSKLKIRGLMEKLLLRKAFAKDLPPTIKSRVKQPYRVPDSRSFFIDGKLMPWAAELLAARRVAATGILDSAAVDRLVAKCAAGRATGFGDNMAFIGVLSTMLVQEQFIERAGAPLAS